MEQDSLIQVEQLSRRFGDNLAVDNVSFEVRRGEVLGFLGPNGAGKSTTMRMITGNLAPTTGSIRINGIDILEQPREAKRALGYLPEQPPLYRELSVDEFLLFCARLNRIPKNRTAAAIDYAKERCGLTAVGRRLINNLSKGYQQRVGIAQAIIHSPEVVILDEPTVGLDPIQIREIRKLIRELGGEHSVILSTHILPEVQATCDRAQIINKGRLVLSDTIEGLGRRMQSSSLLLGLRRPPASEVLLDVSGVIEAEALEDGRLRITHRPEQSPAEALAKRAVAEGWGLFELVPERLSLEDVFVDITTEEEEVAA
ncbi:MAG: ABC transporter ATP-binding protein [Gammaproteobacteria bacterium]|nr:ABC transporter ATP-binding protein [Gammaproteobacteria bacterium]MCW8840772.1 ABC transporter ATP-binding protein [Gammaproteobacteria bacterium]MCW8927606.1 ABC transporter ATP-binding protein [Gammaproteobacteria bacterium]MCW8958368.1 ABC transporter ATP-binding protein [Gammaproteobacteria bacterium]MCW8972624.1 ABC transporter ATP-binding protein [Gammaproteobacteria bacterium]